MHRFKLFVALLSRSNPSTKWCSYTVNHSRVFGCGKYFVPKRFSSHTEVGTNDKVVHPSPDETISSEVSNKTTRLITLASNDDSVLSALESEPNVKELTDNEILNFIASLKREPVESDSSLSMITRLENECIRRARKWDVETFLDFYKHYQQIGFAQHSKFPTYALQRRSKYVFNRCSLPIILEFLRLVNSSITGRRKTRFNTCNVEFALNEHLDALQPDQVASFIHLLSSSGKNLRNEHLSKNLCTWFASQARTIPADDVRRFTSLFAGRDATNPLFITPWLVGAFKSIEGRLHEFDLDCLSVIASTCLRKMIIDEAILEKIASKLVAELPAAANVHDIASIVEALVNLNYHSKNFDLYNRLVERMREPPLYDELRAQPKILCRILAQLSIVDVYPYHFLKLNFSNECLQRGYKSLCKYNVPYEVRQLLGNLRLDRPDYRGKRIGFNLVRYQTRKHKLTFPKVLRACESTMEMNDEMGDECVPRAPQELSPYNRVLYSARNLLNHIFGSPEYTHVCYVLPHSSRANILFVTNKAKQPQKLLLSVRSNLLLKYTELDWSDSKYYVLAFRSKNIHMDYEPVFMGEEIAKTRQVRNLGFEVISLVQHGWFKADLRETIAALKKTLQEEGIILPGE